MVTETEINEYLKSIGGLHYGYMLNTKPCTDAKAFEVSPGWYGIIKDMIQELVALGWTRKVSQVKEKFGGLRFYAGECTQEMNDVIGKYMVLSKQTCEGCGKPGTMVNVNNWYYTRCEEHTPRE